MTEIEKKAQRLENACALDMGLTSRTIRRDTFSTHEALCRAIEQHEAFRQEVSDSLEDVRDNTTYDVHPKLWRYIRTKPADPLVEALNAVNPDVSHGEGDAELFRAALAKRGLQVTENER